MSISDFSEHTMVLPLLLNEKGALCLSQGNFHQASEYFRSALESGSDDHLHDEDNSVSTSMDLSSEDQNQKRSFDACDHRGHFIYSTPFVCSTNDPHKTLTKRDVKKNKAVILFNLALTYQQMLAKTVDGDSFLLHMAERSYDRCLSILKKENLGLECPDLILAAINNQANLCYDTMDFAKSSKMFQLLFTILRCRDLRDHITLPNEVLQNMILNINFSDPPNAAGAA